MKKSVDEYVTRVGYVLQFVSNSFCVNQEK